MRCDEAEEFVSAVYDGETVPPRAAEHMAHCAACQELLKGYAEMGASLRSYGSLLLAEPVPERTWLTVKRNTTAETTRTKWWEKGLGMMRIPRIAFASLVLLLMAVGSRLALVEVRAHDDGSVLSLQLTTAQGEKTQCFVPTVNPDSYHCGALWQVDKHNLYFGIKAIKKDGGRVLLSIRSKVTPLEPGGYGLDTESTLPETQSWFTPGEALTLPGTGDLKLALTGEWTDHIPVGGALSLDPGPNDIRLVNPLLLKNDAAVGDIGDANVTADRPGEGAYLYIAGEGRFLLSSSPIAGAVPATVHFSRVSFESDGHKYVLVSGMPVSRAEKLWVLHDAAYKPATNADQGWSVGAGPVSKLQ